MRNLLLKTLAVSIPAMLLIWFGIMGFFQACEMIGLNAIIPLATVGCLVSCIYLVNLIWDTYFRWASKIFLPELHPIWFPKDK